MKLDRKIRLHKGFIQYAIVNRLHTEYFIWCIVRKYYKNGKCSIDDLSKFNFPEHFKYKIQKENVFFSIHNDHIYVRSEKKINIYKGFEYVATLDEYRKICKRLTSHGIKDTFSAPAVRRMMIAIFSSQYGEEKPYCMDLIAQDLNISHKTVQRALNNIFIEKTYKTQKAYSPRSYFYKGKSVNLTPNFNLLQIGHFVQRRFV